MLAGSTRRPPPAAPQAGPDLLAVLSTPPHRFLIPHRRLLRTVVPNPEPYPSHLPCAVRRVKLEEWVNEPFLEDTLPGCMVRVVGPQGGYLLAQVIAVETRPPGTYK